MSTYYLFLDELKANDVYNHFCLGGCIVEDAYYRNTIIPYVNSIKQSVFGNTTVILHESQIRQKRADSVSQFDYSSLKNSTKEAEFWSKMKTLFSNHNIRTMCVGIDYNKYKSVYTKSQQKNSEYFIALQIILENFVHFLQENNGKGAVYIESRGIDDDQTLEDQYNTIKNNGTLFIEHHNFNQLLKTISFPMKADNNIGVQIADFIPNPIARHFDNKGQRPHNLYAEIKSKSYDGNKSLIDRFGLKKVL